MSRQLKKIDPDMVKKLAGYGLTQKDIGNILGCGQATISRRFGLVYELGVSESNSSLRAMMWDSARGGNTAIILRLDDRLFGQLERKPAGNEDTVLEDLYRADAAGTKFDQGKASTPPAQVPERSELLQRGRTSTRSTLACAEGMGRGNRPVPHRGPVHREHAGQRLLHRRTCSLVLMDA